MPRILVTGACGRLGQAIMQAGQGRFEFVPMDRSAAVLEMGGVQCDLMDVDALAKAARGCDMAIHTAAMHGGDIQKATPADYYRVNIQGTGNVMAACLGARVKRVVNVSTLTVLYGLGWLGNGKSVVTEESPLALEWVYPDSKYLAEQVADFYARNSEIEVAHLRYAWIRPVGIEKIGAGLLARSVAASDAGEAALCACVAPGIKNEVFLIGPDSPVTQSDIDAGLTDPMGVVERYWPGSAQVLAKNGVQVRAEELWPVARIDKAMDKLNWRPQVTFERYLETLGWASGVASVEVPAAGSEP
jgi:nucleoside-diphosphate-sugar epimerase